MKRCTKCLMPETARNIAFDEQGVCLACKRVEERTVNGPAGLTALSTLCKKYRKGDGSYDCIIPVSGGKDSFYQLYIMKEGMKMNPLLVSVTDEFTHTNAGQHNAHQLAKAFRCDMITLTLNPEMVRETTRWGFENIGSTNWAVDMAIYVWPLQQAVKLNIPLVVYGENVEWEYGCKTAENTYSARNQIRNNVVELVKHPPIHSDEMNCLKYPSQEEIDSIEPIYLSYFTGWDGMRNFLIAKKWGFRSLAGEWDRNGYIDDFWQIDSVGYLMNYYLKYAKYGYSKATDVASHLIRHGYFTRESAIEKVRIEDGRLDQKILDDFLRFTGYGDQEFWRIMSQWYNPILFDKFEENIFVLKEEHLL